MTSLAQCLSCGRTASRIRAQCKCGAWHTMVWTTAPAATMAGPVCARDALGADMVRIPSGLASWDRALCGGPPAGTTILLFGVPGAGKSTEALRLAGAYASRGRSLVLTSEMPAPQVAAYCARLDVPLDRVDVWHVHTWREARRALDGDYTAIVVDSIQPFAMRGDVGPVLRDLARATRAIRIVVGRVNKRGEVSGVRDLDHDVDVVARITKRSIQTLKSRIGEPPKNVRR